jgi:Leucine-rich repeat (LRR) protein
MITYTPTPIHEYVLTHEYALQHYQTGMTSLKNLYLNSNSIAEVPEGLCLLVNLMELNLANNAIEALPAMWHEEYGPFDYGLVSVKNGKKITLIGNVIEGVPRDERPKGVCI